MKYDSLFDPMVLLFVGSSYVLTLLVGSLMVQKGQINGLVNTGHLLSATWNYAGFGLLMAIGFLFNITQRGKVSYQRIEELFVSGITCTRP